MWGTQEKFWQEIRKVQTVQLAVLRKLGFQTAKAKSIAGAMLASLLAVCALSPAAAQLYSQGYEFLEAVKERDGDTVTEMLNQPGTQVINTRDITTGDTGLHVVTARRDALWVKFLLQRGANPNIRNNNGLTPLIMAARLGFIEGAEELIRKGADISASDSQGETPLMTAVHQRNIELIRRLLAEGADPDRNDNSGRSARDYMLLMNSNSLMKREFDLNDEKRAGEGTQEQYGPSF